MADQNALMMINPFEALETGRKRAYAGYEAGQAAAQREALNELYAQATDPRTGEVNMNALYAGLAQRRMGAAIPGMQQAQADIAFKQAQAAKQSQEADTAFWTQSRAELATLRPGDRVGYESWANRVIQRAPWAAQYIASELTPETQRQMLMTADAALPKGTTTEVGGVIVTTDPYTGKEIGKVDYSAAEQAARAAGRSSQVVNLPPSESERGKVLGRLGGEALVAEYNAAQSASKGLSKDYEAIRLLREGKPATGITSELETTFNRFRADVAGDKEAAAKVSDSQFLEALLGSDVFNQIAALGVGARGLDTPAEREFLREVISGTRKLDKSTLIRMAELRAKYKEEAVDAYNERVRSGELDEFFRDFGRPKREFAKPERPKISDQPEVVRTPDGKVFTFPNKAAADKFRKEAGL